MLPNLALLKLAKDGEWAEAAKSTSYELLHSGALEELLLQLKQKKIKEVPPEILAAVDKSCSFGAGRLGEN